jgi:hypothetical protein
VRVLIDMHLTIYVRVLIDAGHWQYTSGPQ